MDTTSQQLNARKRNSEGGPTEKMREYLEVIYYLSARKEPVIAARLAEWLRVTAPTVSNMVGEMEKRGYITRNGRSEISLTEGGFTLAEAMVKRHRILECFLVQVLQVPWDEIHEEAVRLEHALSPTLAARIEALVGANATCPHGNPIPGNSDGYPGDMRLDRTTTGQPFKLLRIVEEAEEDGELMRYMQANGLIPGTSFEVGAVSPSYGARCAATGRRSPSHRSLRRSSGAAQRDTVARGTGDPNNPSPRRLVILSLDPSELAFKLGGAEQDHRRATVRACARHLAALELEQQLAHLNRCKLLAGADGRVAG